MWSWPFRIAVVLAGVQFASWPQAGLAQTDLVPYWNNPVVRSGETGEWDCGVVCEPTIVMEEGEYYLFYTGSAGTGDEAMAIGYAVSSNGVIFEKHGGNPVFEADGSGFDGYGVREAVVQVEDGVWVMYYNGQLEAEEGPGQGIGRARAEDPGGPWTRSGSAVVEVGSSGEWDSGFVTPNSVLRTSSGYAMYYSGGTAGPTEPPMVGMATSSDGMVWVKYDDPATTSSPYAESDPIFEFGDSGEWDSWSAWSCAAIKPGWSEPENVGPPISSEYFDGDPYLSHDDQHLYFVSKRYDNSGDTDIWVSEWSGSGWGNPANLGGPINSGDWERGPFLLSSNQTMYFSSFRPGGYGESDIYRSTWTGASWVTPRNLGSVVNTEARDGHVWVDDDEAVIFLYSRGHDGYGEGDIFYSEWIGSGWGAPTNLGSIINGETSQCSPELTADMQTMYFHSDLDIGGPDRDVFVSRKVSGEWTEAINLGSPLNSASKDQDPSLSADGRTMYFASERPGGEGDRDIWMSEFIGSSALEPWEMYYTGSQDGEGDPLIGFARSSDGVEWKRDQGNPVFEPVLPWEDSGVVAGSAILVGSQYYLYYTGYSGDSAGQVGVAISMVADVDDDGDQIESTSSIMLGQVWPNPFTDRTVIEFSIPEQSYVRLRIVDLLGREVSTQAAGILPGGRHRVVLDGEGMKSGVYVLSVEAGECHDAMELVLTR